MYIYMNKNIIFEIDKNKIEKEQLAIEPGKWEKQLILKQT